MSEAVVSVVPAVASFCVSSDAKEDNFESASLCDSVDSVLGHPFASHNDFNGDI